MQVAAAANGATSAGTVAAVIRAAGPLEDENASTGADAPGAVAAGLDAHMAAATAKETVADVPYLQKMVCLL